MEIRKIVVHNSYPILLCILLSYSASIKTSLTDDELCKIANITTTIKQKGFDGYVGAKSLNEKENLLNYYKTTVVPSLKQKGIINNTDEHFLCNPSDFYFELIIRSIEKNTNDPELLQNKSPDDFCSDIIHCEEILSTEHELRSIIKTHFGNQNDIVDPEYFLKLLNNNVVSKSPLGKQLAKPVAAYWKLLEDCCPGTKEQKNILDKNTYEAYKKIHATYRKFLTHPTTFSRLCKDRRVIAGSSLIIGL